MAQQQPQRVITSQGPLTNIYLDNNLACQVTHVSDSAPEFFGETNPGACGTFLSVGATVFGPDVPLGNARTPYNLVRQTGVSGSGSSGDPFRVITVVEASGLTITQIDSYVVGQEAYRTDIEVTNNQTAPRTAVLYHAADCFLQDQDDGYGFQDPSTRGIFCTANPNNNPAGRVLGFVPLSPDSHFYEAGFGDVWSAINGSNFPDTCDCGLLQDNGAGLSWTINVPPGGSEIRSLAAIFTPGPALPPLPPRPPPLTLADLPNPRLGVSFNVQPVSGTVLVGIRAGAARAAGAGGTAKASQKGIQFVPLTQARQIPIGSFLDTRRGTVRLQSARNRAGARQTGDFLDSIFQVKQSRKRSARGLTDLILKGASFRGCATGRRGRSAAAAQSRTIRRLRGNARGRFRTSGRHSSATVRGTRWGVHDRCDGTLTRVQRGRVVVRDFRRQRNILLTAGKQYLARAPR
jgi:hypothetical protein